MTMTLLAFLLATIIVLLAVGHLCGLNGPWDNDQ